MKSFFNFIQEVEVIKEASASLQAARLGLQSDGNGGWYKGNEFTAKTVKGRLKFYNKRENSAGKDSPQTELEKNISDPNFQDPAITQQQYPPQQIPQGQPVEQPPQQMGPPPVEKTKGSLTVAFGRFNPPTIGHQQLMDTAALAAEQDQGDYIIVPSRSQDGKKNPLDVDTKISYMRRMFPQHSERIVNDTNHLTIFDVLKKAHNDGYANVRIVSGANRIKEFDKLANNYNGVMYQFDNLEVIPSGDMDFDSDENEPMSSSRLRLAAIEGDFKTFRNGLPPNMPRREVIDLFDLVRQQMGIQEIQQEGYNIWEIAPKYDTQTLRENYISGKIYNLGDLVENLNTGLIGRIIRRGTNYLICVTEDNIMFKSWIKDVNEAYTEKHMDRMYREPGKPNTLVGTVGALKYFAQQTKGYDLGVENLAFGQKNFNLNFINKYKHQRT